MIDPTVFLKLPLAFKNICSIYPPSVNDVISNPKSIQLFKLLTYSQEDIEDLFFEDQNKNNGDHGAPEKHIPTPLEFVLTLFVIPLTVNSTYLPAMAFLALSTTVTE